METMTPQQMAARIAELEAKLNKTKSGIKVSPKGAVSVYGLGRFPVTLYASQWEKLAAKMNEIVKFINENRAALTSKED